MIARKSAALEGLRMIRTGQQHVDLIRDCREVYVNAEKVTEVPSRSRKITECQQRTWHAH